jgi:hypothetical protein
MGMAYLTVILLVWFGFLLTVISISSVVFGYVHSKVSPQHRFSSSFFRFVVSGFVVYIVYYALSLQGVVFIEGLDRDLFVKFIALQIATYVVLILTVWNKKLYSRVIRNKSNDR